MSVTPLRLAVAVLVALFALATPSHAQDPSSLTIGHDSADPAEFAATAALDELAGNTAEGSDGRLSTAVEIAILLTVLSVLPGIVVSVSSFTRIVIVLSFVRRSIAINELPPNPVMIGLALFLTAFVMGPVVTRTYDVAYAPYQEGEIGLEEAGDLAWRELSGFLLANTRASELELFADMAQVGPLVEGEPPPVRVLVPAFILSELKTAFQMGFLLFLPFLVIDLVIASVLLSMGMFMLPPVMISTPFKILLFVLIDGWHLVCESLVTSFIAA